MYEEATSSSDARTRMPGTRPLRPEGWMGSSEQDLDYAEEAILVDPPDMEGVFGEGKDAQGARTELGGVSGQGTDA